MEKITLNITEESNGLVGELTRNSLMQIPKNGIKQIVSREFSIVDLQQVSRIDTAGLAWLFYLLEQAESSNCQLSFRNIPTKFNKLINVSGVEGFLPIDSQKL